MDIEERKRQTLKLVELLEEDIETLQNNIRRLKEILPEIKTEEDAKRFASEFDVEKGLKTIELF